MLDFNSWKKVFDRVVYHIDEKPPSPNRGRKTVMDKGLNILIVEDEYISGILLESLLSPYGRCRLVKNGREGLATLSDSFQNGSPRYDLVLLDLELPGMSG
ncbi:MAG TPA: hypothetical protein VK857_14790, partial [Desulforhopalus sp.]|nr:hypothetical protein [Desulforhopalus sp.]